MEPAPLKLVMVQGPREGETIEFRPGSTIRIGRVVRGNNVTIKDDGISSKHLLIISESGKWVIQDLDTSNGTVLNSNKLPPLKPFDLRHGDTIKFGEYTSILVQFSCNEESLLIRRNPRRKAKESEKTESAAANLGLGARVSKETEGKIEVEKCNVANLEGNLAVRNQRGRQRKARVLDKTASVEDEVDIEVKAVKSETQQRMNLRSTRGRKKDSVVIVENLEVDYGQQAIKGRRTRRVVQKRNNLQELPPESVLIDVQGSKESQDLHLHLQNDVQEDANEVDGSGDNELQENANEVDIIGDNEVQENANEVDISVDKKVQENTNEVETNFNENVNEMDVNGDEDMQESVSGVDVNGDEEVQENVNEENDNGDREEKEVLDSEASCKDEANVPGCKSSDGKAELSGSEKLAKRPEKMDLEKMTLAELFDYGEMQLSKVTIQATEEMLEGMRKKAKQVKEYMMDWKRQKSLVTVA